MPERDTPPLSRQPDAQDGRACDPDAGPAGPPREAGGTTGEGNLSPQGANRTGGATGGVGSEAQQPSRSGTIPPDA
jgi:hypothetical protein